jgi:hypothetical protein
MLTVQYVRLLTWQSVRHMADSCVDSWHVTWHVCSKGWRHMAQSMAATCHIYIGLKLCCWPESTPRPPGRGERLGKSRQPVRHWLALVIYMEIYLYMFSYVDSWGVIGLGLSPQPLVAHCVNMTHCYTVWHAHCCILIWSQRLYK